MSTQQPAAKSSSNFLSSLSNFAIQYNLSSAGIALAFMATNADTSTAEHCSGCGDGSTKACAALKTAKACASSQGAWGGTAGAPDYPKPAWVSSTLLGTVFVGAVVGMVTMGYAGDKLGRRKAFLLTTFLSFAGSALSALASWGDEESVYGVISACRFVIGVGVGGLYPLSAAHASEGADDGADSATRVGWAFFWQTPGSMAPYVVAVLLLQLSPSPTVTSLQFRLLLGLGAIPSFMILVLTWMQDEGGAGARGGGGAAQGRRNPIDEAMEHPEYFRTLVGTAGTWFVYDVSYYGTAIFTPQILVSVFGSAETLMDTSTQSLIVASMGVPGCILAIKCLKTKGSKWLSTWGFLFIGALFFAMAVLYRVRVSRGAVGPHNDLHVPLFALFCALTFGLNFGPNVSTFVLPTQAYPYSVRSTFHGLSAACGKLGAVVGTFMYTPIANSCADKDAGIALVMFVQAGLCVLGAVISVYCIDEKGSAVPTRYSLLGAKA